MPSLNLVGFGDHLATTGPKFLKKKANGNPLVNDAALKDYGALEVLLSNRITEGTAGTSFKTNLMLSHGNTATTYRPGDVVPATNPQTAVTATTAYAYVIASEETTEQEVMLNEGVGDDAIRVQYTKLAEFKMQRLYTDLLSKVEKLLCASPVLANMGPDGRDPYSIPYAITTDGLAPSGFTDVYGPSPTAYSKWRSHVETYDSTSPFDVSDGLITAMEAAAEEVDFRTAPVKSERFTGSGMADVSIVTSKNGRNLYKQVLRSTNDFNRVGPQEAGYPGPVFYGRPIVRATAITENSLEPAANKPYFYFINTKHFRLVVHPQKWCEMDKPVMDPYRPGVIINRAQCYINTITDSRQRLALVRAA